MHLLLVRLGLILAVAAAWAGCATTSERPVAAGSSHQTWELWPEVESGRIVVLQAGLSQVQVRGVLGEPKAIKTQERNGVRVERWNYVRPVLGQFALSTLSASGGHYSSYQRKRYEEMLTLEFTGDTLTNVHVRRRQKGLGIAEDLYDGN